LAEPLLRAARVTLNVAAGASKKHRIRLRDPKAVKGISGSNNQELPKLPKLPKNPNWKEARKH
jgi:hypothetical protein